MLVEICLPVKNEEKILAANLQRILDYCENEKFKFDWKIIGLINGSSDKTLCIFLEFKKKYPTKIDYIEINVSGKSRALREYWKKSKADIVSYLDIDLAVLPDQLPDLLNPIIEGRTDLAIGSRLSKKSLTNRSWSREISSQSYNLLARALFLNKVSDLQCGFKAIRRDVFEKIAPYLKDNYWFFDTELIILNKHFSYRLQEIPVNWDENRYEKRKSKVKLFRDIMKFLKCLLLLRIRLFFIPKN